MSFPHLFIIRVFSLKSAKRCIRDNPYLGQRGGHGLHGPPGSATADIPLEEFVTKVHLLVDDSGYQEVVKEEMLRDTLVFGLKSDKVRRDAIAK